MYFLGPLAALLLVSRPGSGREWFWIILSLGGIAAWAQLPTSLAEQTVRSSAVFFTGALAALTMAGIRSLFSRVVGAIVLAAAATIGWGLVFHFSYANLQHELITQTWDTWRKLFPDLPAVMPAGDSLLDTSTTDRAREAASFITLASVLYPAGLAVTALAGGRLTWAWYQRIARMPLLPDAPPFRHFRFNDHFIWVFLVSLGLLLLAGSGTLAVVAGNILAVTATLYALRGAAVARTTLMRASPFFILLLLLITLPLFYVVPVGLTLLGIADTWLDFRRRMAPPTGVST